MVVFSLAAFVFKAFIITSLAAGLISSISSPLANTAITDSALSPVDIGLISEDHPSGAESLCGVQDSDATLPVDNACVEFDAPTIDYASMTAAQLKSLCKDAGLKRYSSLRKAQLIDLLSGF